MAVKTYTTKDGDMLDRVCWKHYGQQAGAVETVLDANRHLSGYAETLPYGVEIILPDISSAKVQQGINMWD